MNARKAAAPRGRRWAAIASAVLVAALAAVSYVEAGDPRFALDAVTVSGNARTSSGDVVAAAAFPAGRNVWLLDVRGAQRRIEALPWIDTADVTRRWPDRVAVRVTERTAVAAVVLRDAGTAEEPTPMQALVDSGLRVLALVPAGASPPALPLFRVDPSPGVLAPGTTAGGAVQQAYDAMVQLRALGLRVSEIDLRPATGVTVTCAGGPRVIIGDDTELAAKVDLYKTIVPKISAPHDVVYVDLRSVNAPTVLYR